MLQNFDKQETATSRRLSLLSEAGYTAIKIIEIPDKNWITTISNKPKENN